MQAPLAAASVGGVTWKHVGLAVTHGLKNAFIIGSTGTLGALGARAAEREVNRVMPLTSHSDMTKIIGQDLAKSAKENTREGSDSS
jgi:hypothetical protein